MSVSPSPSAAPPDAPPRARPSRPVPGGALRPRLVPGWSERLARSAAAAQGRHLSTEAFPRWLGERRDAGRFRVTRVPFAELDGWSFEPGSGNLVHRSGRFFSVEGLHVRSEDGPVPEWHQPVIRQPEVGVLGILVKEFDGVLHCLMQAKMEPGNPNLLQLSPTVQATRSNFTKVHRGADVKYIEYFDGDRAGRLARVVTDSLQSEHGSWFLGKSNRNMVVEALGDVPLHEDFCWLTLGQLGALLRHDNVVNMDSRTVLSCLPLDTGEPAGRDRALHTDQELLSWFTGERARRALTARAVPLRDLPGWEWDARAGRHRQGRYFDVVGVAVEAGNREITSWRQPLFEPRGRGVTAFLAKRVDGVPHVLVHARAEAGFLDTVQLAPTVQYTPGNYAWLPPERRPPFLDLVLSGGAGEVRYDVVHAEEGGRFLNAESRYQVIEVPEDFAAEEPPGHRWFTLPQLASFVRQANCVNVQARTLLACLALAVPASGR
ncbi:NDP-hexose 2,3-dehydratase family protein [Streptomyces sp. TG1A-8]|uniref:NDP-hexose 2,3-dehydratase family protein n=1 Tax=Streptomyces sp. TG1A-8 TaxID=3051385 RepID=UPI00265B83D5|nr:NDP-hexose 2,3-dehydratase family protein [Streptomyces sp. TG1A-8]MDO0926707.1 NDP-hexose 2,3-dehydratase family protein [Streptomyces sp. TG1A-8]